MEVYVLCHSERSPTDPRISSADRLWTIPRDKTTDWNKATQKEAEGTPDRPAKTVPMTTGAHEQFGIHPARRSRICAFRCSPLERLASLAYPHSHKLFNRPKISFPLDASDSSVAKPTNGTSWGRFSPHALPAHPTLPVVDACQPLSLSRCGPIDDPHSQGKKS